MKTHPVRLATCLLLMLALTGCDELTGRIPPDKTAFVGNWIGNGVLLVIDDGGKGTYRRRDGLSCTSMSGPLHFEGDNFKIGMGPLGSLFVVNRPPYRDSGEQKIVIDGRELTYYTLERLAALTPAQWKSMACDTGSHPGRRY